MDKDEYVLLIEELNGYCSCKELKNLSDLGRRIKSIDEKCYALESSIDFEDPKQEDRVSLELLKEKKEGLENLINNDYNPELNNLIKQKKLKLFYHDEKNNYKKKEIDSEETLKLSGQNKIITIHCSNCDQQIDLTNCNQ